MHTKILFILTIFLAVSVRAAPFVVSDPSVQTVTHCGVMIDATAKVDSPVESVTGGKRCKYDVGGISTGTHTIKATFVNIDPVWGRSESVFSVPLSVTRPGAPVVAPAGLVIE